MRSIVATSVARSSVVFVVWAACRRACRSFPSVPSCVGLLVVPWLVLPGPLFLVGSLLLGLVVVWLPWLGSRLSFAPSLIRPHCIVGWRFKPPRAEIHAMACVAVLGWVWVLATMTAQQTALGIPSAKKNEPCGPADCKSSLDCFVI